MADNLVLYNGSWASNSSTTNTLLYTSDSTTYYPPLPPKPKAIEGAARPEDPFAWLRRRVAEVSWQPEIG